MTTDGMLEGKAKGGPRDGVKLSAPPRWDGRVRLPLSPYNHNVTDPESVRVKFYQGHYEWKPLLWTVQYTWVWVSHTVEDQPKRNKARAIRSDKRDW